MQIDSLLYTVYILVFIVLSAWTGLLTMRSRTIGTAVLSFVNLTMIFENAVLALGGAIGHSDALLALSWGRFIGMATVPPLLIVCAVEIARRTGIGWANRPTVRYGAWAVAVGLSGLGVLMQLRGLDLVPRVLNGVVRYMSATKMAPPIPIIIMSVIVVGVGLHVWRRTGNAALFLGAAIVFVGDALTAGQYALGSGVETLFMVLFVVAESWSLGHVGAAHRADPGGLAAQGM